MTFLLCSFLLLAAEGAVAQYKLHCCFRLNQTFFGIKIRSWNSSLLLVSSLQAYSMPIYPPYLYLLPLQQAHAMQPKLPSRSPSPHFPPPNAPTRHQEAYPPNHPTSVPAQHPYGHQAVHTEPHRPSEPSFSQARYPVTQPPPHRMPGNSLQWQQHQMPPPSTSSYPGGYPSSASPYQLPPPPQGYHTGQGTAHPLYPPTMTPYPPSSLGYQSSSNLDELQVAQGVMEQLQPTNGDALSGHGPGQVPGPHDGSAAASCVNNFGTQMFLLY